MMLDIKWCTKGVEMWFEDEVGDVWWWCITGETRHGDSAAIPAHTAACKTVQDNALVKRKYNTQIK